MAFEKQDGPHWKKGKRGNLGHFNHRLNETRQSSPIFDRGNRENEEVSSKGNGTGSHHCVCSQRRNTPYRYTALSEHEYHHQRFCPWNRAVIWTGDRHHFHPDFARIGALLVGAWNNSWAGHNGG